MCCGSRNTPVHCPASSLPQEKERECNQIQAAYLLLCCLCDGLALLSPSPTCYRRLVRRGELGPFTLAIGEKPKSLPHPSPSLVAQLVGRWHCDLCSLLSQGCNCIPLWAVWLPYSFLSASGSGMEGRKARGELQQNLLSRKLLSFKAVSVLAINNTNNSHSFTLTQQS